MDVSPRYEAFAETFEAGAPQVVWTKLAADLETPVSAMLKLGAGRPNSFLLESVEGGAIRGRYSIIGLEPDLIWRCRGAKAEINLGRLSCRYPRIQRHWSPLFDVQVAFSNGQMPLGDVRAHHSGLVWTRVNKERQQHSGGDRGHP